MDVERILLDVGLTPREARVYLGLLELGLTTAGPLIKRSEVPNSKIYEILEGLQNKGLVSWITKGKTKYFQAAEPRKILALFEEKKRIIEESLPILEAKVKRSAEKSSVELFEGIKAIRAMFLDLYSSFKPGESIYGFSKGVYHENALEFYSWLGMLKSKSKALDHLMISLQNKQEFVKFFNVKEKMQKSSKWKLRFSTLSFPWDFGIYHDRIIILNWSPIPTAVVIVNRQLVEQSLSFYLQLWKNAKS